MRCRCNSEESPGVTLAVFVLALPAEPEDASASAKKLIGVESVQVELKRVPGPERAPVFVQWYPLKEKMKTHKQTTGTGSESTAGTIMTPVLIQW